MSKDVDRNQVFKTTRVRTSLKNDVSWIHKSKQEEEQDKAGFNTPAETKPSPVRQKSYVLLTAKKFESLDPAPDYPPQKSRLPPSEGDSANQTNVEVILPQKNAQPEGSTVETTNDSKPQGHTEEPVQNEGKIDANTAAENNDKWTDAPVDQFIADHVERAVKVHVEQAEQVTDTTAGDKREQSNIQHVETKISADAHMEDPAAETFDVLATMESEYPADRVVNEWLANTVTENIEEDDYKLVDGYIDDYIKRTAEGNGAANVEPTEELVANITSENNEEYAGAPVNHSVVENSITTAAEVCTDVRIETTKQQDNGATTENKGECDNATDEESKVEHTEAKISADAHMEDPVAETCDVTGIEENEDLTVLTVKQLLANTVTENKEEDADTTVDQFIEDYITSAPQGFGDVDVELAEQHVVDTNAVNEGECADTSAEQSNIQPIETKISVDAHVEDPVAETCDMAGTGESKDPAEAPAVLAVEQKPQEKPSVVTEPASVTHLKDAEVESTVKCAEERCDECPPKHTVNENLQAVAAEVVESSPETPVVNNATPKNEAAPQSTVQPALDAELPVQSNAETAVKSEESEVEPAAPTEPVLKSKAEELVEGEIRPVNNTIVEQSPEPAPENAADHMVELSIEDALDEPATVQEKLSDRAIELTDALDVVPPTAEAVPEPVEGQQQSQAEESKMIQTDVTTMSEMSPKSSEELNETRDGKHVCSYCGQTIDDNIKLTLNEPPKSYHVECLKCGVCAKALGDLMTPFYLHDQVIHCCDCLLNI